MGTAERRLREKEARHNSIVGAARALFLEKGLEATTMEDIAREAELSKGTLYLYFENKEELIYALLLEVLEGLKERVERACGGGGSGYDRARRIIRAYLEHQREHFEYLHLSQYLDYQVSAHTGAGSTAYRCFAVIDDMKTTVIRVLREGQEDGSIRAGLDPEKTAVTYVHAMESFVQKLAARGRYLHERTGYPPRELIEHLLELMLYSLT
ncbi:MAG: TetR/AcrR family transcriptional regulator [Spirochaetota bacterium]